MANRWTKEQKQAIDARGSDLLIAAAAGSGKTAVLVERIITKLLREEQEIDRLLVVTFTNAAASEMRQRIGVAIAKQLEETPRRYPFAKPDGVFAKGRYQDHPCLLLAGDSGILSFVGA